MVMFGIGACSVSMAISDYEGLRHFANRITEKLPSTWQVVEEKTNVIPYGHYYGLKYDGQKGLSLLLEGKRDVFLHWKDKSGVWDQEALAKESLELWIMPPEYRESWKRFFIIGRPKPAELIFSGKEARVYGYPAHRIGSNEKSNEILLSRSSGAGWPDSPVHTGVLSWGTWKEDIKEILQDSDLLMQ